MTQGFNAEDAEDFTEERKGGCSSANLCEYLCALCVEFTSWLPLKSNLTRL